MFTAYTSNLYVRRFQSIRRSGQTNTQVSVWAQPSQSKVLWRTQGTRWGPLSIWGA